MGRVSAGKSNNRNDREGQYHRLVECEPYRFLMLYGSLCGIAYLIANLSKKRDSHLSLLLRVLLRKM